MHGKHGESLKDCKIFEPEVEGYFPTAFTNTKKSKGTI